MSNGTLLPAVDIRAHISSLSNNLTNCLSIPWRYNAYTVRLVRLPATQGARMYTISCDICKKEIPDYSTKVSAGYKFENFHLCETCGQPILNFLVKKKLLDHKNKTTLQSFKDKYAKKSKVNNVNIETKIH